MSSPWRSTCPSTLVFGIVSCIRLRHRIRVDFPQPEGPMTAVTMRSSMSIVMSWIASFSPYQAESDSTLSLIAIALSSRNGSEPDDDARYDAEPEHHDDEDQRYAPSGLVLRHVRSGGPDINGVRQRLDRLVEATEPVVASKRGDEEGGGFSRDSGNPEEPARDQCAARGRNDDPKDGPVPRDAPGEGRFPHGDAYEAQGLFRGARHERHHDGRQREDSRNRAEHEARAAEPDESQLEDEGVDENPDDHGGDLGHDLDEKPDSRTEAILPEFGQIDSRQDAYRQRNERREEDQDQGPLDCVADAPSAGRRSEEGGRKGSKSSDGGLEEDAPQRNDGDDHTDERGDAHGDIDPVPPRVPIDGQLHAAPSPRRSTRATMSLAKMLMINDMSMRTRPSSMNALNSSGVSASVKLLAIQLAIVCPWSKRDTEITFLFPIVMVTAIVSPTARPRPRITAPKMPARAYRRTANRVVSQRVAPRLSAASR